MTGESAAPGWRERLAERRRERRERRAWRRERRRGSIDPGAIGASDESRRNHGSLGPAGQQSGAAGVGGITGG